MSRHKLNVLVKETTHESLALLNRGDKQTIFEAFADYIAFLIQEDQLVVDKLALVLKTTKLLGLENTITVLFSEDLKSYEQHNSNTDTLRIVKA